jgi:hypothetical protein
MRRLIHFSIPTLAFLPVIASAQNFIICEGTPQDPCTFEDLITVIQNIFNFIVFDLLTPIIVILIAIEGFKILTAGENAGQRAASKKRVFNIAGGYMLVLAAVLIVKLIFSIFFGDKVPLLIK